MVDAGVFTPYTTAVRLFGTKPSWIQNDLDIQRIQSYQLYEEIYWAVDGVFKLNFRGTNDQAIYIPTARMIVDTTNRYTAPSFAVTFADRVTEATDTPEVSSARLAFTSLFKRERFYSKFNGAKRYGLIRGDWIWHVTADPSKAQGSRISIVALDPGMYFPIPDDNDVDDVIGCHLVSQITTPNGPRIHRLTYRKTDTGGITVEEGLFKLDKWEGPADKPEVVIRPVTALPPEITALPVYHVRNFDEPGNPFGSSEIRGFERVMSGVNQTISDEDLALALEGIGMYWTNAPDPTDDEGHAIPWRLGPGRVVSVPNGDTFGRLNGVGSVSPYGDHFNRLMSAIKQASSTPDIAIGSVDVQIASSGIALALQLQPLIAKASEKNQIVIDVHNQMMFDLLHGWYPAYEQLSFDSVDPTCVVGSAVPIDRAEKMNELNSMLDKGVIDTQYYRDEMAKLGYVFPDDIAARVKAEADQKATQSATAFGVQTPAPVGG